MNIQNIRIFKLLMVISLILLLASCSAGHSQFTQQDPAGFWYGIWHGIISVVTLIIHVFNDNVLVYEINNTGGWYDFGFLFGVITIWGGGSHVSGKTAKRKDRDKEWDEICGKVEIKVMRKLKAWANDEDSTSSDPEWEDISDKVEHKLKRKIREWADKE